MTKQLLHIIRYYMFSLFISCLLPQSLRAQDNSIDMTTTAPVTYKTITVKGMTIFYREAGSPDKPAILLLHGFPSSSRMYQSLLPLLCKDYHLIAPDYPGFGYSDAPPADSFAYTFDHIAAYMNAFTTAIGLQQYVLFMQDYGGPVGFRMALQHPDHVQAIVIQNAAAYEQALSPLWEVRKAFWKDRTKYEPLVRENFASLEATRTRHIGTNPHPEQIDPDSWNDEYAFLSRPGQLDIQLDLFYDYQTNVASYPKWQQWMKQQQPPVLVIWGRYDPSFTVAGAWAFKDDVPNAEVHVLDAGHFVMDTSVEEVAVIVRDFLHRMMPASHAKM